MGPLLLAGPAGPNLGVRARPLRPLRVACYNSAVLLLAALATWLVLSALVALLVCLICRAGHAEDVARRYVEDRPGLRDRP